MLLPKSQVHAAIRLSLLSLDCTCVVSNPPAFEHWQQQWQIGCKISIETLV